MKKIFFIAGGGTGGHIFPAIAIAEELKRKFPDCQIIFFGALGKMEMTKIPEYGYTIIGLPMVGFNRKKIWANWVLPFKILESFITLKKEFKKHKPNAVFGVGGYSTFPVLVFAQFLKIPNFIHEANAYPGKANIWLGKRTTLSFGGFENLKKFFPKNRFVYSGNPLRSNITNQSKSQKQTLESFQLNPNNKTILIVGGSLGAQSFNQFMDTHLNELIHRKLNIIWQVGEQNKHLVDKYQHVAINQLWIGKFINNMYDAYTSADLVISRAGALAVFELIYLKKPTIFIPFPFATENHQYENAKEIVQKGGAFLIENKDINNSLLAKIDQVISDPQMLETMKQNLNKIVLPNATEIIVNSCETYF
ncbi:MAG: undecaprenyldiphospho-muramoylpentapeptide beta-N-acetylglucosaminyltransferase [Sediminibacterium sp.]|nr:undecaprenyldiphospho-muramoylpentapeptide beta-N-acetylglucosaminyltransferase [Sediminibacterium sp.]